MALALWQSPAGYPHGSCGVQWCPHGSCGVHCCILRPGSRHSFGMSLSFGVSGTTSPGSRTWETAFLLSELQQWAIYSHTCCIISISLTFCVGPVTLRMASCIFASFWAAFRLRQAKAFTMPVSCVSTQHALTYKLLAFGLHPAQQCRATD